jgi:protein arginine N-methyltransferase 1
VYSVFDYGAMLADRVRTGAYSDALRRTIRPDESVVLDIGTGTGIWALLACRYGARRVYAVDSNEALYLGEQLARENGYAERITFIDDVSTRISLPEPVDIVVADIHGTLPQFGSSQASLIDARRFLRPGGAMIPCRETMWAAVADDEATYRRFIDPWDGRFGIDMSAGREFVLNSTKVIKTEASTLLTAPQCWLTLDYGTLSTPNGAGEFRCEILRRGVGHGLIVWFDSVLSDGVGFSNAPGRDAMIFGQVFFPWSRPVALEPSDEVAVSIRAALVETNYVWTWSTRISARGGSGRPKASFDQTTFRAAPLSLSKLHQDTPEYVPERSPRVSVDHFVLSSVDGRASLHEIAARAMEAYPGYFANAQEALAHVRGVVNRE